MHAACAGIASLVGLGFTGHTFTSARKVQLAARQVVNYITVNHIILFQFSSALQSLQLYVQSEMDGV